MVQRNRLNQSTYDEGEREDECEDEDEGDGEGEGESEGEGEERCSSLNSAYAISTTHPSRGA